MGRAQQMMMEQGLDWFDAARLPDVADTPAAAQVRDFWHDSLILWQRFLDPAAAPPAPPAPPASEGDARDKRFKDPAWREDPYFD
ncbi:hypothetical protein ABI049_15585, partial [Enterococcus faecium]